MANPQFSVLIRDWTHSAFLLSFTLLRKYSRVWSLGSKKPNWFEVHDNSPPRKWWQPVFVDVTEINSSKQIFYSSTQRKSYILQKFEVFSFSHFVFSCSWNTFQPIQLLHLCLTQLPKVLLWQGNLAVCQGFAIPEGKHSAQINSLCLPPTQVLVWFQVFFWARP